MSDTRPPEKEPNILQRMARIIRKDVQQIDADAISKELPAAVMPREAVVKKRVQKARIDKQTEE